MKSMIYILISSLEQIAFNNAGIIHLEILLLRHSKKKGTATIPCRQKQINSSRKLHQPNPEKKQVKNRSGSKTPCNR
jgi:hypothetical protein